MIWRDVGTVEVLKRSTTKCLQNIVYIYCSCVRKPTGRFVNVITLNLVEIFNEGDFDVF